MATKTIKYVVKCELPCARCAPAAVIICLKDPSLIAQKPAPIIPLVPPETSATTNFVYHHILGTIYNVVPNSTKQDGCIDSQKYFIQYDDTQVNGYQIKDTDIKQVTCEDCSTQWVRDVVGDEIKLELIAVDTYRLTSQHGVTYEFNVGSGSGGSGPQGAQGSQGAAGAQGPQGATGASGGGAPTLACGLQYIGSDIAVKTSGVWPTGQLAFTGPISGGGEIYCDAEGKIRAQPAVLATSAQAAFVGSGGTPPTLLNVFNNPSLNRIMTILVVETYEFDYTNFGGSGLGPLVSIAVDGGPLAVNVRLLAPFSPGLQFGGSQGFSSAKVYTISPGASINVTRQYVCVKQNVDDVINTYAVGLVGIGVAI